MYFPDIKFLKKELVMTQAFASSKFKNHTPKPSS